MVLEAILTSKQPRDFYSVCMRIFTGDLAAVRVIGVFVIAGCPQGEN